MADGNDSDNDSDGWGMEELVIKDAGPLQQKEVSSQAGVESDDEEYWKDEIKKKEEQPTENKAPAKQQTSSQAMIIVDITQIKPDIHSRYDRNSVNDPEAASALRKSIESDYIVFSKDACMIADGTVIPCGSSVWRDALVNLRDERPGHYFVPVFPPKIKS